jgi:hypothetical protein
MTNEMKAILGIINSNKQLKYLLLPYVDIEKEHFYIDKLNVGVLSSGEQAAIAWAKAFWDRKTDVKMKDLMESFSALTQSTKKAVIAAFDITYDTHSRDLTVAEIFGAKVAVDVRKAQKKSQLLKLV